MSDNLIIREDGIGRLIRGVDALEIKLQNGGTSRWVRFNPRDQKSVNANGEYHATDDGVDGYRTITVNVPTRTKSQEPGRDQEIFNPDTGTGYYTDDDGLLHEEFVPDEIRIMHVPDKTTYQDGEPIDLEGIVVQAYRDGEVWTSENYPDGYIPVHELSISNIQKNGKAATLEGFPTVSFIEMDSEIIIQTYGCHTYSSDWSWTHKQKEEAEVEYRISNSESKKVRVTQVRVPQQRTRRNGEINHYELIYLVTNVPEGQYASGITYKQRGRKRTFFYNGSASPEWSLWDNFHNPPYMTDASPRAIYFDKVARSMLPLTVINDAAPSASSWTGTLRCRNGYIDDISSADPSNYFTEIAEISTDIPETILSEVTSGPNRSNLAEPWRKVEWLLSYADEFASISDSQRVTISWPRPKDNKILSATFNIYVEAAP